MGVRKKLKSFYDWFFAIHPGLKVLWQVVLFSGFFLQKLFFLDFNGLEVFFRVCFYLLICFEFVLVLIIFPIYNGEKNESSSFTADKILFFIVISVVFLLFIFYSRDDRSVETIIEFLTLLVPPAFIIFDFGTQLNYKFYKKFLERN